MRWYNINVQQKAFPESPLTIHYTYLLQYVLDGNIIWTIVWCELPCLASLTQCSWLEILWGWYCYWAFSEKNKRSIRPSEFISLYLVVFGCNLSIMLMLSSQPLKKLSYFFGHRPKLTPKRKLQKQISRRYPGCDPCYECFFCYHLSWESSGKYSNTKGSTVRLSITISGTHMCCILFMSLCNLSSFCNL